MCLLRSGVISWVSYILFCTLIPCPCFPSIKYYLNPFEGWGTEEFSGDPPQKSGHAPRLGQRSNMKEAVPNTARRRCSDDMGQCRRAELDPAIDSRKYCKKNSTALYPALIRQLKKAMTVAAKSGQLTADDTERAGSSEERENREKDFDSRWN